MPKKAPSKGHDQHNGELTNRTEQTSAEDKAIDAAIKRSIDEFGA